MKSGTMEETNACKRAYPYRLGPPQFCPVLHPLEIFVLCPGPDVLYKDEYVVDV